MVMLALPDIAPPRPAPPRIESSRKSLWRVGAKDTNGPYFNALNVYFEVET